MVKNSAQIKAVSSKHVEISSGFWYDRQSINRKRTIPAIYRQMEKTGQLEALNLKREHPNTRSVIYMFWDSDPAKWLEAVGYSLQSHPDPALEQQADELISRMAKAQQPDGYLNTYFSVLEPQNRWRNLRDWHEMYNAGHLIEGAVAYAEATGKRQILDILCRYADLIDTTFGPNEDQKHGYCGHPEIELALVKLYHATGEKRYLNLSKYFIDERGKQPCYFDIEAAERGDDPSKFWAKTYHYCQAHAPIREQAGATGHAVRACYLYAGVADIARETNDPTLLEASRRFWDDLTQHQMYITGGLGPAHANEGFTFAYDLPNETAYAETCASISLVLWAHRMFHLDPNSRYIDVMERALYNGVMSGVSYDGETFFYANPLASYPHVNPYEHWSGIQTEEFYRRSEWFFCACCPPNLARIVANIGEYIYSASKDTLFVNLYAQSQSQVMFGDKSVKVRQTTSYPWDGNIQITLNAEQDTEFTLALRIPDWCNKYTLSVNGSPFEARSENGYVHLTRTWVTGDSISLILAMPVEKIVANPRVRQDAGCIALQRGPVVYCIEQTDNGKELANIVIPQESKLVAQIDQSLFGGICVIKGDAIRSEPSVWSNGLYQPQSRLQYENKPFTFTAIPYCFWANREPGEMRVWVREI